MIELIELKSRNQTRRKVDADEKCPSVSHREVEKSYEGQIRSLQQMMMYLGMDSHCQKEIVWSIITQLINNMYETQEWPKDLIEVISIAFKWKPRATTCSNPRAVSLSPIQQRE
jgi:hypothetical protein